MVFKTKQVQTSGEWKTVDSVFGITMTDNGLYSIQVVGVAKMYYGSTAPSTDCFTINFSQPFTYEKKSGENLYILTDDNTGTVVTIAG